MSIGRSLIFQRKVIILKYVFFISRDPSPSSHYKWTLVKYVILVKIMITSELDRFKNIQNIIVTASVRHM